MAKITEVTATEYLEISRKAAARAVSELMAEFDFVKARKAIKACGWRFAGASDSPTVAELKKMAEDILKSAIDAGARCTVGQGPLEAETLFYDTPAVVSVVLRLVPQYKTKVYVDGRVVLANKQRKFKP